MSQSKQCVGSSQNIKMYINTYTYVYTFFTYSDSHLFDAVALFNLFTLYIYYIQKNLYFGDEGLGLSNPVIKWHVIARKLKLFTYLTTLSPQNIDYNRITGVV